MNFYKENELTVLTISLTDLKLQICARKILSSWQKNSKWKVNNFKQQKQKIFLDNDGKQLGSDLNKILNFS